MKDVVIVGGGVAGLGAALTLCSLNEKSGKFSVSVFDGGKSDFKKAELYNVPFLKKGFSGIEALNEIKAQINTFGNVEFKDEEVISITGEKGNFEVKSNSGSVSCKYVILATGAHELNVTLNGKEIKTVPHELMPKPGMIRVEFSGRQQLQDGIYVAGLVAGVTTMFATALGSGVEAACAIFSDVEGKVVISHDSPNSRA